MGVAVAMLEVAERLTRHALGRLALMRATLSRAGRISLCHQGGHNRDVVHFLHATPAPRFSLQRCNSQPIQDPVAWRNIRVTLPPLAQVRPVPERARLAPDVIARCQAFPCPCCADNR